MVFGVLPEKQMKDALLTSGRYLVPGDGYKAVVGSRIARKYNLKVGDELEMKSKRLQNGECGYCDAVYRSFKEQAQRTGV